MDPAAVLGVLLHHLSLAHAVAVIDHEQADRGHVPPWGIRDVITEIRGEAARMAQLCGTGDPENPNMPPSVLAHLLTTAQNRLWLERYNLQLAKNDEAAAISPESKKEAGSHLKWQEHLIAPTEVLAVLLQEYVNEQARVSLHGEILMDEEAKRKKQDDDETPET